MRDADNARMPSSSPAKRHSPAAERNAPYILAALQRLLPHSGLLLEVASGSGQHAASFSAGLPGWQWQPSEREAHLLDSISAWCADQAQVQKPLVLDVLADSWLGVPARVDAVYCANMIHSTPWPCTAALMRGAARHLSPAGLLITYGPYLEDDVPTAPSNLAFDVDLRQRDARWGLRHLRDVATEAQATGLRLRERIEMPANNLILAWERMAEPA